MALVDLARFDNINPVSLRDISLRQGISLDYLEQIFSKLKKNQIVQSTRGTQGGYVLSKKPNEIKLTNIFTTPRCPFSSGLPRSSRASTRHPNCS